MTPAEPPEPEGPEGAAPIEGGPVETAAAPAPEAGPVLAPGLAKALEALEAGLDPEVEHEKGWVRAVRIAGRRLRVLLKALVAPGDPEKIKPLRRALRAELDALSAARDAEVIRKWFTRADVEWSDEEELVAQRCAPPAPPPQRDEGLRGAVAERLAPVVDALREEIRRHLPEDLLRPLPEGVPGVTLGEPEEDRLPAWKQLRKAQAEARARRAARVALDELATPLEARLPAMEPTVPETNDLHDLRRSGRRLRYLLEALRIVVPGLDDVRAGVKQFQWLLGQVNDRRLVSATLERLERDEELTGPEAAGITAVRERLHAEEQELLAEARELLAGDASPEALQKARRAIYSG